MSNTVAIDCFPSGVKRYSADHVIVAIDVIRATTLAVTAADSGRRCFVARDTKHAFELRKQLGEALLAGELAGDMPDGFNMNNSPADLVLRTDIYLPLVMLSSSGTELMLEAAKSRHGAYVACFRNYDAVAQHVARLGKDVAVIGAGSRNQFREEDQICCAWVAGALVRNGFDVENSATAEVIRRWAGAPAMACAVSKSVSYLRTSGQVRDLDFIMSHVNEISTVVQIVGHEVMDWKRSSHSDQYCAAEAA